jgi:hypothetical protein
MVTSSSLCASSETSSHGKTSQILVFLHDDSSCLFSSSPINSTSRFASPCLEMEPRKYFQHLLWAPMTLLLRFTPCTLNVRHCFSWYVVNRFSPLLSCSFAQFAAWLACAPIMCSHFPHGNEHVITCVARLFFAS